MTNPHPPLNPDHDKDHGAGVGPPQPKGTGNGAGTPKTPSTRAGRVGRNFRNVRTQHVVRHQKTAYVYRIGIRLPKEKLRQFPRYNGKVGKFLHDGNGPFVTLKVPPLHTILNRGGGQIRINTSATAVSAAILPASTGTLLSGTPSIFSEEGRDSGLITPITNESSPGGTWPTNHLGHEWRGAEKELLLATTGSSIVHDQPRLFCHDTRHPAASTSFEDSLVFSSKSRSDFEDFPVAERLLSASNANDTTMAPVKDTSNVHNTIKDIIQHLTDIQIQTHGYIPATQDLLVDKLTDLANSLSQLKRLTSPTESPNNYIHQVAIAPEIVDYVDDGRNPDIFTRDFVENVQRGNAVINGKQQAFKEFTEIFAQKLKEGIPGVSREVDRVLKNAGFNEQDGATANGDEQVGLQHGDGKENGPSNG
ncbi:uncharacterized protein Z519_03487 [Cladophialophora bantiana CBS 173.52]|uniref:Mediator of RNA polymerase II transcription subunit 10 n=1 Tax=Cladophialophora bantiana (strain ATCC 10958 / CBS 173.52 / CDC B-1940 / NIH 8579) TaxID=1442370 RepID=A0A0D2HSH0_CLAB1|nr:uncharacterized protein Z519_03487 [Cladophialophora bantiana CBS 173.52]KIW96418.1 hypothetical protein Z519_03487 [Cladophialophora bantiana CBS 173.52]